MFGQHREKHREQEERAAAEDALQRWQAQHDAYEHVLDLARNFHGEQSSELVLKKGEALFGTLQSASLIEDRAGKGEWKGRSQGVSFPIGSIGGRSVRYRVGASKGHYVRGTPVATAIDHGTVFITNQRVVFRGAKQNRECLFTKMISVEHEDSGESIFAVSNRQKNTVIQYGPQVADWFRIHYQIAFADSRGTRDEIVREVEGHLAELDRTRPGVPAPTGDAPASVASVASVDGGPARWAPDPTGRHELRYWNGSEWTDHVADGGVQATDPLPGADGP